jgi:hypothetical protein
VGEDNSAAWPKPAAFCSKKKAQDLLDGRRCHLGWQSSPSDAKLTICSGDVGNEWFVIIEEPQREPLLLLSLGAHCGEPATSGDASDRETLDLLAGAFSGRTALLDEIKTFLDRAGISYRSDFWGPHQRARTGPLGIALS